MTRTRKQSIAVFLVVPFLGVLAWRLWPDSGRARQPQRNNDLVRAVLQGRLATATALLDEGADPNAQTQPLSLTQKAQVYYHYLSRGMTVPTWSDPDRMDLRWSMLQVAVVNSNADMVNVLLARGADVGHRDRVGETALNMAKLELNSSLTTPHEVSSLRRIIVQLRALEAKKTGRP